MMAKSRLEDLVIISGFSGASSPLTALFSFSAYLIRASDSFDAAAA